MIAMTAMEDKKAKKKKQKMVDIIRQHCSYTFPNDGYDVHLIPLTSIHPLEIENYFLPHIRKPVTERITIESQLYNKMSHPNGPVYDACVNVSTGDPEANDLPALERWMDQDHQHTRTVC